MIEFSADTQLRQVHTWYGFPQNRIGAVIRAHELFEKSYREAVWSRVRSWFTRRSSSLLFLHPASLVQRKGQARFQSVPLSKIKGSCGGRTNDFDAEFRPRRRHNMERWLNVAVSYDAHNSFPPVDLVKVDGIYFVVDGHHRLSVAASLGLSEIDARVTEWSLVTPA